MKFPIRCMLVVTLYLMMHSGSELLAICCELPINPPGCADTSSAPPCLSQGGTTSDGFCNTSTGDCEANPQLVPVMPSLALGIMALTLGVSIVLLLRRRAPASTYS
jgi:hypothetical protein